MNVWEAIEAKLPVMRQPVRCHTSFGTRHGLVMAVRAGEPAVLVYWQQGDQAWCHSADVQLEEGH